MSYIPGISDLNGNGIDDSDEVSHFNRTNSLGVVFFYIGLGFFVFAAGAFLLSFWRSATHKQRIFSNTSIIIVCIAATAYLCMGMGTGYSVRRGGRWIYWARYIDWAFTTPLLIWDLGTFAGVGLPQIILAMFFDLLMILTGLFGALTSHESRRWVWFGMGCLAFFPVMYMILFSWRRYRVQEVRKPYTIMSIYLVVIWLVYPISWGLGTGGEVISVDAETVWVTCLDIIAKSFYGAFWLFAFRSYLPYADGEIADRLAKAPRHPDANAPPSGVVQPQDTRIYHSDPVNAAVIGSGGPANIPMTTIPPANNPAVLSASGGAYRRSPALNSRPLSSQPE